MSQASIPHFAPLTACVLRGSIAESRHEAHIAESDADGNLLAAAGDFGLVTTLRSAAKPLQAIPAVTLPGAFELNLSDEEVAICCASHPGTPRHAALAASVLALSGFVPDNLVCGIGFSQSPLRHGCSGNHAAILLVAHLLKVPLEGYDDNCHPAQQVILEVMKDLSGTREIEIAIDGCGIPTFGLPLQASARAFASLTRPGAAWGRIPRAMSAHPDLIGSRECIDVLLMEVTGGRLIAKTGAEGLLCIGQAGRGIAIKIMDGSTRALGAVTIAWLLARGWISAEEAEHEKVASHRRPPLLDPAGKQIGEISVHIEKGVLS